MCKPWTITALVAAVLTGCDDGSCPEQSIRAVDGLCYLLDDDTGEAPPAPVHGLVVPLDDETRARVLETSPLPGLPASPSNRVADDPNAAALGEALFFEPRFSRSGALSCASCHDPNRFYADGERVAFGEELYPRNTGSLVNVAYYEWVLWDGGCDTIWCQANKPLENRHEMNADRMGVVHTLAADAGLRTAYESVFGALPDISDAARFPEHARPDHLDPQGTLNRSWEAMGSDDQLVVNTIFANVAKALEAYQRTLVATESPYDTFVAGLKAGDAVGMSALSPEAQRGLVLFFGEAGCTECHSGPLFSSEQFVNVGLDTRSWLLYEDNGRFEAIEDLFEDTFVASGAYSDDPAWGVQKLQGLEQTQDMQAAFRVPTLRNLTHTAPYMHGGHFDTLGDVLHHYNRLEETTFEGVRDARLAPLSLTDPQLADLEAFLQSLSTTTGAIGRAR